MNKRIAILISLVLFSAALSSCQKERIPEVLANICDRYWAYNGMYGYTSVIYFDTQGKEKTYSAYFDTTNNICYVLEDYDAEHRYYFDPELNRIRIDGTKDWFDILHMTDEVVIYATYTISNSAYAYSSYMAKLVRMPIQWVDSKAFYELSEHK